MIKMILRSICCFLGYHDLVKREAMTIPIRRSAARHVIYERVCRGCGHSPTWER